MIFQAACNRVVYVCGCVTWLELEKGAWVLHQSRCYGHWSAGGT